MGHALALMAVLMAMAMAAGFLLLRRLARPSYLGDEFSAVSQQHIHLFQGGHLNEALVDSTKARFRELLERGELATIEASLRPGMLYVVQVRALTELGTDDAGVILERQLQRRLTDDQLEQSWYWIDLANGLRALNRSQSLPHLLRCADSACDLPTTHYFLSHFFAAETVCFMGFAGYLSEGRRSPLGRAALKVLHRALEGLREAVPPQVVTEARIGELIEGLWDRLEDSADPLVVRVFLEALRVLRRAGHAETLLGSEMAEQEAYNWQVSRLAALEPALAEYLKEVPAELARRLVKARLEEQRDILLALNDLRAEAGAPILQLLDDPRYPHTALAVEALAWSREQRAGDWLRQWVLSHVPLHRRAQARRRAAPPRRPSIAPDLPYRQVLRALRGHPAAPTESILLAAARDWDPTYRAAAVASLGWWEPLDRAEMLLALQDARRDPNPDVREKARSALARLGERQALQWFRQMLASEDVQRVHHIIHLVGQEGLLLLWPDLDSLADAEDMVVAHHARETLERLSEELSLSHR